MLRQLLRHCPDLDTLAQSKVSTVERLLRPIGLHRVRARALVTAARTLVRKYQAQIPDCEEALLALPHVGRYGANAVLCFAYHQRRAVIDANVARIYHRVFGTPVPIEIHKAEELWKFARAMLPQTGVREFNWALLDLGGLICMARNPCCSQCPLVRNCMAHQNGTCGCSDAASFSKNKVARTIKMRHS